MAKCCDERAYALIPLFHNWLGYSGNIPEIYWNIVSSEQRYKFLRKHLCMLVEYSNVLADGINVNSKAIEALAKELADLKDPDTWDERIKPLIDKWIDEHLRYIFETVAKQVFFGLTYQEGDPVYSGHFVAYVPDSWQEIEFDTGMVYGEYDYGRLILRYNADGSGVIDNTGRYDETMAENLLHRVETMEKTLYTALNINRQ